MNRFVLILFYFICISLGAQTKKPSQSISAAQKDSIKSASTKVSSEKKKANIKDYIVISHNQDTTHVDTSLTITKDYKFNYLRKDNFNLMQFSNIGQTYNTLSYNFYDNTIRPSFGAEAKHFNYYQIEDVDYYRVPTPLTELQFKTAFEQGQLLDAFFTVNTSPNFNFSIAYKGLRSLGKYQHILSSTGNLRFTTNYITKSKRYKFKAHIVTQDLLNEENGGLTQEGIENFESGNEEFLDRSVFDPNFENAESKLVGKRFYIDQEYNVIKKHDSTKGKFSLRNITVFEDKSYRYDQSIADEEYFGNSFNTVIKDKKTLENFNTSLEALFKLDKVGDISAGVNYNNYNYGYDQLVQINGITIPNRIKGYNLSLIGGLNTDFDKIKFKNEFKLNVIGEFSGYYLNSELSVPIKESLLGINLNLHSTPPNFNTLLFQSDYINYNWNNQEVFENVQTRLVSVNFNFKNYFKLSADYTNIENFTYFTNLDLSTSYSNVKPKQFGNSVDYFRLKFSNQFSFGKFTSDNSLLYQNVLEGNGVLNTPDFITRNTVYFSDHLFKKALFLQIGITFNYFSDYHMNAYNPLLGEFFVQNDQKLGGFPRLDFFINAKVRQTRIFLKAEHFNSAFTGYNYYSAPNYPFRDFSIRFGLVWNFFM
ncbi:putative porin [Ichthyenterobacterium sp. W332]|uniref:Porin n=1 Tax=Microcosmobacter mediterraneus TaxID=3075607 RepID=A0ABU2YLR9_9FLAO|nr:putative porin [Ichthyenterobacterium sp. W332]MDT0559098.1 putative porin [Ichthyenterobacterium sp. W332]